MHQFCLWGRGGNRGWGAHKKKSPDFRSSEVGISAIATKQSTGSKKIHQHLGPIVRDKYMYKFSSDM